MADLCPMQASATLPTFELLPAHARVWIYKSATPFTQEQRSLIRERGFAFTNAWKSHGQVVVGAMEVLNDHFIALAADIQDMRICGGAIDASTRLVKELERDLGLQLTDRMVVVYELNGALHACRVPQLEELVKNGTLNGDTIVFDDLVATKGDLDARFRTSLRNTWMARYL